MPNEGNKGPDESRAPQRADLVPPVSQAAYTLTQTQVPAYVPPHVWTTDALVDYHQKQKEVILDNNRILESQRAREFKIAIMVLAGFALILGVGFWFTYIKIDLGRDIVISAVSAGLGYLAGYGAGLTKKQ